ncbi:MAG: hypothetical protein RIQ94_2 [Pseudomonadota bacterium]|jgi:hypothetical protein
MTPLVQPNISVKTFRFYFKTESQIRLPAFPGSAWRGALGHALKKTVCVVRNQPCNACLLKNACAYSIVFETPPPSNAQKMRKYTAAPHPFVLKFPTNHGDFNTDYHFDVLLFGNGQRYLPYLIHAFKTAGQTGIGGHRQVFNLHQVDDINSTGQASALYHNDELNPALPADPIELPEVPQQIKITFVTPLRLVQESQLITETEFDFGVFFSTLLRRQSMLSYFHTDTPLETDFADLTQHAKTVHFENPQLEWFDWTRYSSRQTAEINMGGLVGSVTLRLHDLEVFWPYLWLGQWTQVGKGTSMGMGAYTIETIGESL